MAASLSLALRLTQRRKIRHWATCTPCGTAIYDVRYSCKDCEDWDCCGDCAVQAEKIHPGHTLDPYHCPKFETFGQVFLFAGKLRTQNNRNDIQPALKESRQDFTPDWRMTPFTVTEDAADHSLTFLNHLRNEKGRYSFLDSRSTGSSAVLELAKAWYDDCSQHHPACKAFAEFEKPRSQWNPTRLLDTGVSPDEDEFQLIECRDMGRPLQYAALSHCWGKNQHLRLLNDNMKDLVARVAPESLSKTFNEAIKATRRLGLRYIWIDSICIIQDSKEDWQAESALMGQIYRHCECCIAATAAPDGTFGCFVDRDPRLLEPLVQRETPFPWDRSRSTKKSTSGPVYYERFDGFLWKNEIELGALTYRGWAYQERILSHRILHFGKSQVFWECRQRNACETYPLQIPSEMQVPWRESLVPRTEPIVGGPSLLAQDTEQTTRQHAYKFWNNALRDYSLRLLTMEEDKFPAISGVAKHVQEAAKDSYLAGLWDGNIVRDLLWRLQQRRPPPEEWRAPTWSWASRNGLLNLFDDYKPFPEMAYNPEQEELIKVVTASVTGIRPDPTGQIIEGHILLYGQLAPSVIKSQNHEVDPGNGISWTDSSLHVFVDEETTQEISNCNNFFPDEPIEDEDVLVYCLPIIDYMGMRQSFISGLLLKPLDAIEAPGVFYRYGIFQTQGTVANDWLRSSAIFWASQRQNFGQPYKENDEAVWFAIYLI